jgi:uncharacterized repeat protein (TIGR01451 family)
VGPVKARLTATATDIAPPGIDNVSGAGLLDCFAATSVEVDRAELSLEKQADRTVRLGDRLTYTISVRNAGPATATGVMITDKLPANVNFVSASPDCRHSDGTVTCEIDDLERGGRARLLITVQVMSPGEIVNTATVAANEIDRHPNNNTNTAMTTVR